jgi:hypothetical protein
MEFIVLLYETVQTDYEHFHEDGTTHTAQINQNCAQAKKFVSLKRLHVHDGCVRTVRMPREWYVLRGVLVILVVNKAVRFYGEAGTPLLSR